MNGPGLQADELQRSVGKCNVKFKNNVTLRGNFDSLRGEEGPRKISCTVAQQCEAIKTAYGSSKEGESLLMIKRTTLLSRNQGC